MMVTATAVRGGILFQGIEARQVSARRHGGRAFFLLDGVSEVGIVLTDAQARKIVEAYKKYKTPSREEE